MNMSDFGAYLANLITAPKIPDTTAKQPEADNDFYKYLSMLVQPTPQPGAGRSSSGMSGLGQALSSAMGIGAAGGAAGGMGALAAL